MKILLAGEYSSLHNQLKEGLQALGHEVHIISTGDYFKNYPSDFDVKPRFSYHPLVQLLRKGLYRLTHTDLATYETAFRIKKFIPHLKNYDIVQLINIYPFETPLKIEISILEKLFKQNEKSFVLACGDDYITNKYYLSEPMKYNIFTPLKNQPGLKKHYRYSLKYVTPPFQKLHQFVEQNVRAFIPTDLDYAIPYRNYNKSAPMIPNPVNTDKIQYDFLSLDDKIVIFHGINTWNYIKKGNRFFSEALGIIREKFADRVEIIETKDLPYTSYMEAVKKAHILLDQVYSYDQGYNALNAMAMGKVVFTGAEKEFTDYYKLDKKVCINALPDTDYLVDQLSRLIENRELLREISQNARNFIEQEHHYMKIAKKYLTTWKGF